MLYSKLQYEVPEDYEIQLEILEKDQNSVPVCRLKPTKKALPLTIVYVHGNSEDLLDSLWFAIRLSSIVKAEFVIFDYSGYGDSRVATTT